MSDWTKNSWYRHRIGSVGSDPKLGKLVRLFGAEGYAVYFMALEYIYDGCCGDLEIETMADVLKMNKEEVISIMETAADSCEGLLSRTSDGKWTSRKAQMILEDDEIRREETKDRKKKSREKYKNSVTFCDGTSRHSPSQNVLNYQKNNNGEGDNREEIINNQDFYNGEGENKRTENLPLRTSGDQKDSPSLPFKKTDISNISKELGRTFDVDRFADWYSIRNWTVDGVPMTTLAQLRAAISRWPDDKPGKTTEEPERYAEAMKNARREL